MATILTTDAIKLIHDGNEGFKPNVQILSISNFGHGHECNNHYKVEISDGAYKQKASLPQKCNHYI